MVVETSTIKGSQIPANGFLVSGIDDDDDKIDSREGMMHLLRLPVQELEVVIQILNVEMLKCGDQHFNST
jgi:hypothetical protein